MLDAKACFCTVCKKPMHAAHFPKQPRKNIVCGGCWKGNQPPQTKDFSKRSADKKNPPDPPGPQDFQAGQGSPLLTMTAGAVARQLRPSLGKAMHPLAENGVTPDTRKAHMRILSLIANASPDMEFWPVAQAALEVLEQERQRRSWQWGTMEHESGVMAGALKRLPQYTRGTMRAIHLVHDEEWRDAMKNVHSLARKKAPTALPAVTKVDLRKAISDAPTEEIRVALILTWALVARAGDVTQLKTWHVELLRKNATETEMTVFFERGKVIGKIDPYHVHTTIPTAMAEILQRFLEKQNLSKFMFPRPSKAAREAFLGQIRNHLRTINPLYDTRSLRRGTAQSLADQGVALATIMTFTKHTDVAMLRRYLRYGKTRSEETRKSTEAANKLW